MTAWYGSASTALTLCASSQLRCPLFQRSVKKSAKMRLCVTTPEMIAPSMNIAQTPASQRPQG